MGWEDFSTKMAGVWNQEIISDANLLRILEETVESVSCNCSESKVSDDEKNYIQLSYSDYDIDKFILLWYEYNLTLSILSLICTHILLATGHMA
jgi:hypothetical protein